MSVVRSLTKFFSDFKKSLICLLLLLILLHFIWDSHLIRSESHRFVADIKGTNIALNIDKNDASDDVINSIINSYNNANKNNNKNHANDNKNNANNNNNANKNNNNGDVINIALNKGFLDQISDSDEGEDDDDGGENVDGDSFDIHQEYVDKVKPKNFSTNAKNDNHKATTSQPSKQQQQLNIGEEKQSEQHIPTIKVAIGSGLTSAGIVSLTEENLSEKMYMFTKFLPSFCKTASVNVSEGIERQLKENNNNNNNNKDKNKNSVNNRPLQYEYHFYIAYDYVDKTLNDLIKSGSFYKTFNQTVTKHCPNSLKFGLHFVRCDHTKHPAWAQNDAMIEANLDDVEYFYRINDDTIMVSGNWTNQFIDILVNRTIESSAN
ncbi:hypothetical protein HELRODRAFT_195119 [Helobdella robusta]|uniref:Uncharacterized protein n=1 Tax=Helobdella robusta TaxID=6412 RepID=T1FWR8_HELRO|nr:hypothetical protein HELRODRAFT_195119 [Helobdella robusta]ESO00743.1 hypothetical protein HELRODRAFT_195119 [Helobdella robusta]